MYFEPNFSYIHAECVEKEQVNRSKSRSDQNMCFPDSIRLGKIHQQEGMSA